MQQVLKIEAKSIVESPKDTITDGEITAINKTTWREYLTEKGRTDSIAAFDEPDQQILSIAFKTIDGITDTEQVPYYEKPSDRSKLGRILKKYGDLQIGTKLKIEFDGDGYTNIKLDKKASQ